MLEILDTALQQRLDASVDFNTSFNNPSITYFVITCLDSRQYQSEEPNCSVIFRSTGSIQGILSKLIYNTRLFTILYLRYLAKDNAVDNTWNFAEQRLTNKSNNCFSEFCSLRVDCSLVL